MRFADHVWLWGTALSLLVAVLHQDQMKGRQSRLIELTTLAEEVSAAFVRAYCVEARREVGLRRRRVD